MTKSLLLANGSSNEPAIAFTADTNTGVYHIANDVMGVVAGGGEVMRIAACNLIAARPFMLSDGSSNAPALTFSADTNTGVYRPSADMMTLVTGGTDTMRLTKTDITTTRPFLLPDGSTSLPGLTFSSESNTGLYRPTSNTLGVAVDGTDVIRISSNSIAPSMPDTYNLGTSHLPFKDLYINSITLSSKTNISRGYSEALGNRTYFPSSIETTSLYTVRAWANFSTTPNQVQIKNSCNVSSIIKYGNQNDLPVITFTDPMPSDTYCAVTNSAVVDRQDRYGVRIKTSPEPLFCSIVVIA